MTCATTVHTYRYPVRELPEVLVLQVEEFGRVRVVAGEVLALETLAEVAEAEDAHGLVSRKKVDFICIFFKK